MLAKYKQFLSDPGVPGPIFVSGCPSLTKRPFVDLTDVTLADEDTKSILTDNANRAIQGKFSSEKKLSSDKSCLWCMGKS